MAAVVYGNSPRHHSRISNSHHLQHSNTLPQSHHYMSGVSSSSNSNSHCQQPPPLNFSSHPSHASSNSLLLPPASYLSTGTPMSSSSLQPQLQSFPYQHQHQHSSAQPQSLSHYHHSSAAAFIYAGQRHHSKRKSAVELLAESKPLYVKSETVLDRHQQFTYRAPGLSNSVGGVGCSSGGGVVSAVSPNAPQCALSPSPSRIHHSSHHRSTNRRSASSSSDLLQTKLRKLLNADAKDYNVPEIPRRKYDTSQKYDTFSKYQTVKYSQELSVNPSADQNDVSVIFPSAFLSPQSLPPHPASDDDIYSYGIDGPLVLTDDYRAISPPAEYAADISPEKVSNNRSNYQRSYSHSHEVASDDPDYSSPSYNINSHKSLPDLHSQISRHSPHSEALSCCSRGNRSNKSGGSSLNRDSGGSSGHYTHRSEPCCKQKEPAKLCAPADFRRDSGSSTQHSGNSYYTYGMSASRYIDCPECRAKFQKDSECLLNFTTPEVPEAFQDDYQEPPKPSRYQDEPAPAPPPRQKYSQGQQHSPTSKTSDGIPPNGGVKKEQEFSPPLGTFKRQKCLRFKHRNRYSTSNDRKSTRDDGDEDRKPILRSKSDISDRYWNRMDPAGKVHIGLDKRGKAESMSQLEKFFDRLGLNDDKFEEIYMPKRRHSDNESDQSSTVFFSDVSTVDSTRLPDSTETNQNSQTYRPTEPPSIVERNARIIKWLCNCRKLQLV